MSNRMQSETPRPQMDVMQQARQLVKRVSHTWSSGGVTFELHMVPKEDPLPVLHVMLGSGGKFSLTGEQVGSIFEELPRFQEKFTLEVSKVLAQGLRSLETDQEDISRG